MAATGWPPSPESLSHARLGEYRAAEGRYDALYAGVLDRLSWADRRAVNELLELRAQLDDAELLLRLAELGRHVPQAATELRAAWDGHLWFQGLDAVGACCSPV
jgi:hypothetical protein